MVVRISIADWEPSRGSDWSQRWSTRMATRDGIGQTSSQNTLSAKEPVMAAQEATFRSVQLWKTLFLDRNNDMQLQQQDGALSLLLWATCRFLHLFCCI
jgi:hypothetical protein